MNAPKAPSVRVVFAARLKEQRQANGLSQKALGVAMGLPEDVAGVRINRYERAVHDCDSETAQKLAQALGVSVAYLYAETDELAELIQEFTRLPESEQRAIVQELKKRSAKL
ncbi:helix-turn-helix domain-containing protein [Stenotrophomonas sp. GD03701]|uniref:XRE family transcriptional regulator n=1 Tax=Stenotrophomonas maltophilia TaxID=40324 RepID=A0A2J0SNB0_STEMA|nr:MULTISPECIES: helix-turn-helix transcriptional regulator [Stenotrophomonas]MBA0310532.1 XRE family transcriptional regulator [Stenotrophomonas maltophilia]MDH1387452.1 helix-turn-helix domain-containing protein [Stenotrophomonas sp. GD03701]MDH1392367.1 helix-turn-helix domain-containing protein [Stenotrophomonas sp. GD03702]MDQ7300952.1 helix-turn-helix transcriptional regulator [Stenotrophomonas sp. Sm0581]PJK98768.1 transcriptional regulator [Stenotrophomonas maltophilia]